MSEQQEYTAEKETITTEITEWAIQCLTRDGITYTGSAYVSRKEAQESGDRLARINGADWWLVSRRRVVTLETSPWSCVIPPGASAEASESEASADE